MKYQSKFPNIELLCLQSPKNTFSFEIRNKKYFLFLYKTINDDGYKLPISNHFNYYNSYYSVLSG
ncbi:hypothetical protein FLAVO9AF_800049 [Flavobacterium sp. 9AF]|nr:hypothetical protein FLAVO9AF_800049 [Flavobacterium sp. 9AF]